MYLLQLLKCHGNISQLKFIVFKSAEKGVVQLLFQSNTPLFLILFSLHFNLCVCNFNGIASLHIGAENLRPEYILPTRLLK